MTRQNEIRCEFIGQVTALATMSDMLNPKYTINKLRELKDQYCEDMKEVDNESKRIS